MTTAIVHDNGKCKMFEVEPLGSPSKLPLTFDDSFGNYISLVDPGSLLITNFLPSTDSMALTDRMGRSHNTTPYEGLKILTKNVAEDIVARDSDGVADAILDKGVTMKRQSTKRHQ